jgi:CheY-like chemotaxis protein
MIIIPRDIAWTTFTSTEEDPDCKYLGGMAICADVPEATPKEILEANPLWLIYGWNGNSYNYVITKNPGLSIGQTCYDGEKVIAAESAQDAIDFANEFQGGEADWIGDVAQKLMDFGQDGLVELGQISSLKLDQHEAARRFLRGRVRYATRRVLIAEDDQEVQVALKRVLIDQGYEEANITLSWNGKQALQNFRRRGPYDLILSDYQMPFMDGLAFIREVVIYPEKKQPKHIAMISGSNEAKDSLPAKVKFFSKSNFQEISKYLSTLEY